MAKIKGWKRTTNVIVSGTHNEVYETYAKEGSGVGSMASRTVQAFGNKEQGVFYVFKAVPAPQEGHFINNFVIKRDNLEENALENFKTAKAAALDYMKANP